MATLKNRYYFSFGIASEQRPNDPVCGIQTDKTEDIINQLFYTAILTSFYYQNTILEDSGKRNLTISFISKISRSAGWPIQYTWALQSLAS